jgi:uncharacterized lipoprotein YddW (UPF0748 family)
MRIALIVPLVLLPVLASAAPSAEMRGLWVVRTALVSPADVDRVVDQATEAGLNALFVQVRGRGDAFYESRTTPRSVLLHGQPASFDPLARLIERAHGQGLQVHAWVNVLLSAHFGQPLPAGHVFLQHPEWLMVPRSAARTAYAAPPASLLGLVGRAVRGDTDVEGYYLSPSAPGVPAYLQGVVSELVRSYPVDGLHLDFIRYPSQEYDYSRAALEGFQRMRGLGGDPLAAPNANPLAWDEYRRGVLTLLAESLAKAARTERPGLVISSAVVPDEAQAVSQKFQAWPAWLSHGIIDAVCPMAYTPDSRIFRLQVERARAVAGSERDVWAGVGAYRLAVDGVVEKIWTARAAGASGVVLFSHESLHANDWRRLREAAFPAATAAGNAPGGEEARGQPR